MNRIGHRTAAELRDHGAPALTRPQKITFAEMCASGVRGLLIYCSDYRCSHSTTISGDRWPDSARLSDIEPEFACQACGQRGADVRPNFNSDIEARAGWRHNTGWKRPFDDPIPLAGGGEIVTLEHAGAYITKLPKAEKLLDEWNAAAEALLLVVNYNGPTMFARIAVMRALNRGHVREFNPDRKDTHWGRRRLARDR